MYHQCNILFSQQMAMHHCTNVELVPSNTSVLHKSALQPKPDRYACADLYLTENKFESFQKPTTQTPLRMKITFQIGGTKHGTRKCPVLLIQYPTQSSCLDARPVDSGHLGSGKQTEILFY